MIIITEKQQIRILLIIVVTLLMCIGMFQIHYRIQTDISIHKFEAQRTEQNELVTTLIQQNMELFQNANNFYILSKEQNEIIKKYKINKTQPIKPTKKH